MPRWPDKKEPADKKLPVEDPVAAMNAYALKVWEGQSVSLSLKERVERVVNAVVGQGFTTEGLVLPAAGFGRYL